MLVSDYNYDLPDERIAQFPPKERGSTRLLVLNRKTGAIQDSYYRNLDQFLNPGDVLILNDTRVMQSRLFCELPDGRRRELVVLERHGDEPQRVMYRGKLHEGDQLRIAQTMLDDNVSETAMVSRRLKTLSSRHSATNEERVSEVPPVTTGRDERAETVAFQSPSISVKRILGNGIAEVESDVPLAELAEEYGTVPLPPYLHRDATDDDKKRYQTVWAKHMGSAAAPTASLNMTEDLLNRLKQKGVIVKYLTLHVGLGTFLPIRSDKVEDHHMHSEWYHIPDDTLDAIRAIQAGRESANASLRGIRDNGSGRSEEPRNDGRDEASRRECICDSRRRIVALGTTVARTLEYYARTGKPEGEDDIFIYPGFEFQLVDALITNYHAPKSTVLMLASAFAGWDHLKAAYDHALAEKYNFLSYGDSMLIC